ncbi:MAG: DUF6798 domain-containing protein [Planctomycetota bacterium]
MRLCSFCIIAVLFLSAALLNNSVPGVGEPHYLSKAKAFAQPDWCSRDFFLSSGNAHYVFYVLVGPLTKMISLDAVALLGRGIQFLMFACGWIMLGTTIGLDGSRRIFSAAVFTILTMLGNFSGEWILGGFEAKVPAWSMCLMTMHFWIRSHWTAQQPQVDAIKSGFCCGIACSFHPVVGIWMAICIGMATLAEQIRRPSASHTSRTSLRRLAVFLIISTLFALPGLLPALRLLSDTSLPDSQKDLANFLQVFWRLKHHLDPTQFTLRQWIYTGICSLAIWRLIRRLLPDQTAMLHVLRIVLASAIIAAVGVMIGFHIGEATMIEHWEWRASLLKFYPFRMIDAFLPMLVAWLFASVCKPPISIRTNAATIGMALVTAWITSAAAPPGYTRAQFDEWKTACDWIRNNTPQDALILTPRESFAFKWYADRAEYVCYKDCPQDAAGILEWNTRLWNLHDWTLASSMDGQYHESDLAKAHRLTNCDFIVTRILGPFESQPLWSGEYWRVYRISPDKP